MREHVLEVGEELVIEGGICLTLLAVEAGEVLLGITAPEPAAWQAGCRPSSRTQGALGTAHQPTAGGVGKDRSNGPRPAPPKIGPGESARR